jgi:hypothetical protein
MTEVEKNASVCITASANDKEQFLQIAAPLSAHSYFYSVNLSVLSINAVVFLQIFKLLR